MTPTPSTIVLVVEDDADTREALCDVLALFGYAPLAAANGKAALDLLRERDAASMPCLIILDVMMPVMDGWEFRAEQQRDGALAAIPVIFLTADATAGKRARRTGAAAFIAKPVEIDGLLDTIGRFAERLQGSRPM
jgi:CheY-like chemotaxis protein